MDRTLPFFELSEVAEVVGIAKTKVANWTIGRPLKITPSVRTAFGRGARNLYGKHDVCLMALAEDFTQAGMPSTAIQKVIDAIGRELSHLYNNALEREEAHGPGAAAEPELNEIVRLIVILGGQTDDDELSPTGDGYEIHLSGSPTVTVTYETDVTTLVKRVDSRISDVSLNSPADGITRWITPGAPSGSAARRGRSNEKGSKKERKALADKKSASSRGGAKKGK